MLEAGGNAVDAGVGLQVRTTVDPITMTDDEVAELTADLHEFGVTEHVLQTVRLEGVRQEYRDLVPGPGARSVTNVE